METNKPKLNIGFFFLCLGLLITLITSVVSFLNLVFSTLDKRFPDVLNASYQYGYSTYNYESIRMALATLIIFFPVFFIVSYFWKKFIKNGLGLFDEIIKKWVIYIILFLSSVVIVVDLVTLVKYFVGGEITDRFIYKVIITLIVGVWVGKHYFISEIKKVDEKIKKISNIISASLAVVFVIGAISYSFIIMGSPMKQRLLRLDDRRITDLQSIQYQVINYWQQKEKLPVKLSDLSNSLTGYSLPVDPEFEKGSAYEYSVKDKLKFELCATFALPMPQGWQEYSNGGGIAPMIAYDTKETSAVSYPYRGGINESWDHQVGRTCFERTIDKDIYPPFSKTNAK